MTVQLTRAEDIRPGDVIDLEGDTYATFISPIEIERGIVTMEEHLSFVENFRYEHAVVEDIEREVGEHEPGVPFDLIVLHTSLSSFGCPHDHRLKKIVEEG